MADLSERPLAGRSILLTRPGERALELAGRLEALGARVEVRPTIAFEPPARPGPARRAIADVDGYDWIVFTSPRGVRFFFELVERLRPGRARPGARLAAIGPATAAELLECRAEAEVVARHSRSEGLARALLDEVRPGRRVLVVRAQVSRPVLPRALRAAGAVVDAIAFYRTVAAPGVAEIAEDVGRGRYDVAVFTSPSTLRCLIEATGVARDRTLCALGSMRLVAIGSVTARALAAAGLRTAGVAREPTVEGIVNGVRAACAD